MCVYGQGIFFKPATQGINGSNDTANVCDIPLLVTADIKAHAEIGLETLGTILVVKLLVMYQKMVAS